MFRLGYINKPLVVAAKSTPDPIGAETAKRRAQRPLERRQCGGIGALESVGLSRRPGYIASSPLPCLLSKRRKGGPCASGAKTMSNMCTARPTGLNRNVGRPSGTNASRIRYDQYRDPVTQSRYINLPNGLHVMSSIFKIELLVQNTSRE